MAILRVCAFGGLRVFCDDVPLQFPSRKAQDLLCFLLLHVGERLERDWIAERLWPMRPPGKARRSLSTALWRLRQTLGDPSSPDAPYLVADRATITMNRAARCWFDAAQFEQQAGVGLSGSLPLDPPRRAALGQALELYRGDFLEGSYDDWCLAERERLQLRLLQVLKRLQRQTRLEGAFDEAISYGQRLLMLDPLQEDVHREMMRCYLEAGQRSQALAQFQRCREVLKKELWVEPTPQTWRLWRSIRDAGEGAAPEEWAGDGVTALQVAMGQFRRALDALELAWQTLQAMAGEWNDAAGTPGTTPHPERGR